MTAAILALCLTLSVLAWGAGMIVFYEVFAKMRRNDDVVTISAWWDRLVRRRVVPRVLLGVAMTALFLFLLGDLVLEWW